METPEATLSASERTTLHYLAEGGEVGLVLDWLAIHRLKQFGFVEETSKGPQNYR